jgi:sugar O-acyltransferase (sialic acid O-acetyltransferase NeuD family)
VVVGAGGHAAVVASTLAARGQEVAGFFDDSPETWGTTILGVPVLGATSKLADWGRCRAVFGIGDNRVRQALAEQIDAEWITVVHPFAWVHPDVRLGEGTVVCAGAVVQPGAEIGSHVILNTRSSVDHHAQVGDFSHLAVAHVAGRASLGKGVFLALGSVVLPKIHVGDWATIGAGAVVTKPVEPGITVVGVPARPLASRQTA